MLELNLNNETCKYVIPEDLNKLVKEQNLLSHIYCFHLNCRSLSTKTITLQAIFNYLSFQIDIITFSENWLSDKNASHFCNTFPGYNFIQASRQSDCHGGVAVFIHNEHNVSILNVPRTIASNKLLCILSQNYLITLFLLFSIDFLTHQQIHFYIIFLIFLNLSKHTQINIQNLL